ncbi:carbohydrate ABC transporter permease [Arcanobacterium phocae]|uniref:carbohydrate ABC transporter permease n=1 Tax=Arcanobacterium phocae TaxID=131112 RepID=UPI001C0F323B|nr:sugar ABC transporter permease [Arcanobacterium phocae]
MTLSTTGQERQVKNFVSSPRRRPISKKHYNFFTSIYLLVPPLLIYVLFIIYPLIRLIGLSFWQWDGVGIAQWNGITNYAAILENERLRDAFLHALILIIFYSILPIIISLPLASLLIRSKTPGLAFFRTIVFLPQVIAMVVLAISWRRIYAIDGPLNRFLSFWGLGGNRSWLGSFDTALIAVGLIGTWVSIGLVSVLLMAGMSKIPETHYEAATIDGVGPIGKFWYITLPSLKAEILVCATLTTINALKTFDLVYMTTSGGPGTSTTVPSYEVYYQAFRSGHVGTAAALAVVLTLVIFLINLCINWFGEREN